MLARRARSRQDSPARPASPTRAHAASTVGSRADWRRSSRQSLTETGVTIDREQCTWLKVGQRIVRDRPSGVRRPVGRRRSERSVTPLGVAYARTRRETVPPSRRWAGGRKDGTPRSAGSGWAEHRCSIPEVQRASSASRA